MNSTFSIDTNHYTTSSLPTPAGWPELDDAALHGLAGDFVRLISPHSESALVALHLQFLVAFGNVIGRGPHFKVEADYHACNLFTALVGQTAKGRKGCRRGRDGRPACLTYLIFGQLLKKEPSQIQNVVITFRRSPFPARNR